MQTLVAATDLRCSVEQPRPNLAIAVKDDPPALVGERYRLTVTLTCT